MFTESKSLVMDKLEKKFNTIKQKEWIESLQKGSSGIGITFEKLLGKEIEQFEIPDYYMFEIKTHYVNSYRPITLFHATPDSYLFEIKRICETYGYPDRILKDAKVFQIRMNSISKVKVGDYYFKLYVDKEKAYVVLNVFNNSGKIIDNKTGWSFDLLKEKLYRKLNNLAYIESDKKTKNGKDYFYYNTLTFYELKDFSCFINAIEKGKISISFTIGTFRSGKRKGMMHDHGTCFSISPNDLPLLFNQIKRVK